MSKIILVTALLMLFGCVSTPQPVLDTSQYQLQGLSVIQRNMNNTIDAYNAEVKKVMTDGYKVWISGQEQSMVDSEGRVSLENYKAMVSAVADKLDDNEAYYDEKAERFKGTLNAQFFDVILLSTLLKNYNESTGITRDTWERLIVSGQGIADTVISLEQERREAGRTEAIEQAQAKKDLFRRMMGLMKERKSDLPQYVDWDTVFETVDAAFPEE